MMTDKQLIEQAGGIRPVARALGHKWHTRVQYWFERDRISDPDSREQIARIVAAKSTDSEAA